MSENNHNEKDPKDSSKMKPEDKAKAFLDAYAIILDIWKIHNDNYFKRGQVAMGIIQGGLFLAVIKTLSPLPTIWTQIVLPFFIALLGAVSGIMWIRLINKQSQYLEFCRRTLRNIEKALAELQIPLEYFTHEALVFGPVGKCQSLYSALCKVQSVAGKDRCQLEFKWSNDKYPDPDSNEKNIHSMSSVSGGMVSFEKRLAQGAVGLWCVIAVLAFVTIIFLHCNKPDPSKSPDTRIKGEVSGMPNKPIERNVTKTVRPSP